MITHEDLLLKTKLQPPTLSHRLLSRTRLLAHVSTGLERRLTLVCAPAGSGKTTLLAQWLGEQERDEVGVVWVGLDENENDPDRFWRYICAALGLFHRSISELSLHSSETASAIRETMLIHIVNSLTEVKQHIMLVLDDYHLITDKRVHQALAFLIAYMPPQVHLALLTRFEPPLPLARLRVRGQMMDICEKDLRFTPSEVEQFFRDLPGQPATPSQVQTLVGRTEGWIAGLQLAAIAMSKHADLDEESITFTGNSRYLMDYLLEEVIGHQPETIQRFLLETSILSRLTAPLCARVFGGVNEQPSQNRGDAQSQCQEMLEHLERINLFLFPLDQHQRWYRYHHLFGEALRTRLEQVSPGLAAQLHMRASLWYEEQEMWNEASEHSLAAGDAARATWLNEQRGRITATAGSQALNQRSMAQQRPERAGTRMQLQYQASLDPLSERELEVLQVLSVGATNADIAQTLVIAPTTVKRHVSNIFSKLGTANRTQAVAQARYLGLLASH